MLDCGLSYGLKEQPQQMNIQEYWHDIDLRLEQLLENGFVKLPSLKEFDLDFVASDISEEMGPLHLKSWAPTIKIFASICLLINT